MNKPPHSALGGGIGMRGSVVNSSFLGGGVGGASMRSGIIQQNNNLAGGGGSIATGRSTTHHFSRLASGRHGTRTGKDKHSGEGGGQRRSRKKKKDDTARVIVDGKDVTPQPLHGGVLLPHAAAAVSAAAHPHASSHADLFSNGPGGADNDSVHGGSLAHGGLSTVSNDSDGFGGGGGHAGGGDWAGGYTARSGMHFEYAIDPNSVGPTINKVKEWTEKELREKHTIKIEETDTMTLFYLPGLKIWSEDIEEAKLSQQANESYIQCLEKHKEKDKYTIRGIQTINPSQRDKEIQVNPPQVSNVGCEVNTADIWDISNKLEQQISALGIQNIPVLQHESDLIARTTATAVVNVTTRAEEEEEDGLSSGTGSARGGAGRDGMGGGGGGSRAGGGQSGMIHTGSSNTPSVHSATQSFHGGLAAAGASFRGGGKPTDRSWHTNMNLVSSHQSGISHSASTAALSSVINNGHGNAKSSSLAGGVGSTGGASNSGAGGPRTMLDRSLLTPSVLRRLKILEQAVVQNGLHTQQMKYRNQQEKEVEEEKEKEQEVEKIEEVTTNTAALIPLWSFSCSLTQNMNVSCLVWNTQNQDLLAAGYGSIEFGHESRDAEGKSLQGIRIPTLPQNGSSQNGGGGMILFWSLKNPCYPAKIFYTKSSVTSMDFSEEHPHLLAVGFYDGNCAIYDIRDEHSKPALISSHATGKHSAPVWGIKFVPTSTQQLTSISTDGSVKQWNMKKGLIPHEIMLLKRILTSTNNVNATTGGSSASTTTSTDSFNREASGMCFDFPLNDSTQYFAGTEDGLIHKCSISYNEQTLENFHGHTGPVYKIRCNPFLPDAFLSCSADWSAMLWSQKVSNKPILKFTASGHDSIQDIVWSKNQACMFGMISREGCVEIWDLDVSSIDPIIKYQIETGGGYLSCISFSSNAPVVLIGTSNGAIELYRLEGTALSMKSAEFGGGQELNASTIKRVPRDREKTTNNGSESAGAPTKDHEEASRQLLERHALLTQKYKEQAKKLESIMEQHNDSKNKLISAPK